MNIKFEDLNLEVIPSKSHEWLLETGLVAEGYGITPSALRMHKQRNADDLIEGKHFLRVTNSDAQNYGIILPPKVREATFWTKKGVVRLGFFIRSEKARQFRDWSEDVIVQALERPIEKGARVSQNYPLELFEKVQPHTTREVQVKNSKGINGHLIRNWSVETAIDYNRKHCKMITGHSPSELRAIGKKIGLKSAQRFSAKEVLRNTQPELAAQMSLDDDLVKRGVKLVEAVSLSQPCLPLISKMLALKMLQR